MLRRRFEFVLLATAAALACNASSAAELDRLRIRVEHQTSTATVTASWTSTYPVNAADFPWRSHRLSGGNDWSRADTVRAGSPREVSFTVPRGQLTDAEGEFCVRTLRLSDRQASSELCGTFTVLAAPVAPPDSLDIQVGIAALGVWPPAVELAAPVRDSAGNVIVPGEGAQLYAAVLLANGDIQCFFPPDPDTTLQYHEFGQAGCDSAAAIARARLGARFDRDLRLAGR